MNRLRSSWPAIVITLLLISSCKKTDDNQTKAVFSYVADGFKVNFTNFSTGATAYRWDFGDGSSSESRSPQHIFRAKGDFLVTLTATMGDLESSFTDTVVILGPNIKIDGDLSDWDNVPYDLLVEDGSGGNITGIKAFASSDFLYFYVEGTDQFSLTVMDLYIDADNNPETGFKTWMYPVASGADFLIEGNYDRSNPLASAGSIFRHVGANNGWGWDVAASFGEGLLFSQLKTTGGKNIIEFSVRKSLLGSTRNYINFALVEMDAGWAQVGSIPVSQQATSKFMSLQL